MKRKKFIQHLGMLAVLSSVSVNSFAGSCDQLHANELRQKAQVYNAAITNAAIKYRINPALITAVITAESCFRNEARSGKGAGGLMQLIPATARRFGVNDRFDPTDNIEGGTRYLRWLLNRYGGSIPHAIAAYNAGEGRVDQYGAAVPIEETYTYSLRVMNAYKKLAGSGGKPSTPRPQVIRVVYQPDAATKAAAKPEKKVPDHWPWNDDL